MKLKSFQVKNFKSIQDSGLISLSKTGISILAGQNESGKSSILEALQSYEDDTFNQDSVPFGRKDLVQEVSCMYTLESNDKEFWINFEKNLANEYKIEYLKPNCIFNLVKIKESITEFTLTRSNRKDSETILTLNSSAFRIIQNAIHINEVDEIIQEPEGTSKTIKTKKKVIDITDNDINIIANIFWGLTPKIILLNDFCDLLPDKFYIRDLKNDNNAAKGYKAVKNFEKISGADFLKLYDNDSDLERYSVEEKDNETISIDFAKAWNQKIHSDNNVRIEYKLEKKDAEDSYVVFYVETKDKQKIHPRLRSKGLIWFLSFWMELQSNEKDKKLIILADEPGLYLHIKAQNDILKVFEELAEKDHQIIYSTHSPNLIDTKHLERISLVINDKLKGTTIEGITSSKINTKNKQDALQPVAHAIGFSVSDFALTKSKNVILEGISDYFYYLGMRKLLNRKMNYSFIPGIGVRKQNTLISFCIGYGLDWVAIFDDDSDKGLDSQKKFQEIKDNLFGNNFLEAEKKMHITKDIFFVENMFHINDLVKIDPKIKVKKDPSNSIGEKRKIVFSKLFYEKVINNEIKESDLHISTISNFSKIFEWIELNLKI